MTQGKFNEFEEYIHVRDIDTKKVKEKFRSITAAKMYLDWMPFGLKNYYEIFDDRKQEVIFTFKNYGDEPIK